MPLMMCRTVPRRHCRRPGPVRRAAGTRAVTWEPLRLASDNLTNRDSARRTVTSPPQPESEFDRATGPTGQMDSGKVASH